MSYSRVPVSVSDDALTVDPESVLSVIGSIVSDTDSTRGVDQPVPVHEAFV
jgi:hypothetical protein